MRILGWMQYLDVAAISRMHRWGEFLQLKCHIHRYWIVNTVSVIVWLILLLAIQVLEDDALRPLWSKVLVSAATITPWMLIWRNDYRAQYPKHLDTDAVRVNKQVFGEIVSPTLVTARALYLLLGVALVFFSSLLACLGLVFNWHLESLPFIFAGSSLLSYFNLYTWLMPQHEIPPKEETHLVPQGA